MSNTMEDETTYDYDLVVIGGGSGGIACAKKASSLGAKVAVCDFVKPSPAGTKWGLGGTCVNVGCIPKKLYHFAGQYGATLANAKGFGWGGLPDDFEKNKGNYCDWSTLSSGIVGHVKGLNFKYKVSLKKAGVKYYNKFAVFVDAHTLELTDRKGKKERITGDKFVLAMGGRPRYPDFEGAKEHCITSDDIFHLKKDPKKTLCVGASYISLECAGFLHEIGRDVTVMVRSIMLRGFDRACASKIESHMKHIGMKFVQPASPLKVEKQEDGRLLVTFKNNESGEVSTDVFDTVMLAVGRTPETSVMGLDDLQIEKAKNGKLIVSDEEQTNIPHIYAIGDIVSHGLELTPVAIQTGNLLASRLFNNSTIKMDYTNVATTVYTPLEYGCIGLSEEDAIQQYGEDQIVVYHKNVNILEYSTQDERHDDQVFVKLITLKSEKERIIGFHYVGLHAGEITQGFALAMRMGATKHDLDMTVGIHPTIAEAFTTLEYGVTEDTGC
mmetsp:Transcript_8747/g.12948  ORF Transcript_8747/g.12948 Transcript_8747/m.12948 type:complete len:497 (+) Transcript_8747:133-1623(+)